MARILIIEDDAQIRSMLKQCLERSGHEVREASSGYEGLADFKSHACELIVTDVFVPNGGKLALIEWLRQASPEVKILAISGGGRSGGMDVLEAAERVGAHRTLQKPFGLQEFLSVVTALLAAD